MKSAIVAAEAKRKMILGLLFLGFAIAMLISCKTENVGASPSYRGLKDYCDFADTKIINKIIPVIPMNPIIRDTYRGLKDYNDFADTKIARKTIPAIPINPIISDTYRGLKDYCDFADTKIINKIIPVIPMNPIIRDTYRGLKDYNDFADTKIARKTIPAIPINPIISDTYRGLKDYCDFVDTKITHKITCDTSTPSNTIVSRTLTGNSYIAAYTYNSSGSIACLVAASLHQSTNQLRVNDRSLTLM